MDEKPLSSKIFFEMLDIVATSYQDATHDKIAKPLNENVESSLSEFIDGKIEMMRLDLDRSSAVRENLTSFKDYLIEIAIPKNIITLSRIAHNNRIVKIDDKLKSDIIGDFLSSHVENTTPQKRDIANAIKKSDDDVQEIVSLQVILIQQQIDEISEKRPNDPEHIQFVEDQLSFLCKVRDSLQAASDIKNELKSAPEAVRVINAFIVWWNENNQKVIGWSIALPAAAIGIKLLQLVGVPISASAPLLGAIAGGTKVANAIKQYKGADE
jgi:hypothetical protein